MILSYGTRVDENGFTRYNFFDGKIFGAEKQIEDIMMYLKAASMGLDIKKRVLLLLGPPGGGKSQILSMLKKGMGKYTRTEKGAIYAIKDCPVHEEPMHLIQESDRDDIWKKYKIKIEGKLCPVCQFRYETDWNRNLNNVPVERVYINEDNRTGIGTFAPSEKNNMEELIGSEDLSKVDYYGNAGDVRAYAFNGELHSANRGIMEFIEVLKAKTDFLHVLLTLAEEQMFKSPRIPLQYVDEALIAHTNEGEFLRFIAVKENEAVIDRLYIVRMPYNMNVEYEELIYHYALKTKLVVDGVSVHPGAVRLASLFAIKTREHKDPLRHGMSGISPRFILNTLAIALVKGNSNVVSPKMMLRILADQVYNYPVLSVEKRQQYISYLEELKGRITEFEKMTEDDVKKIRKQKSTMFDMFIGESE
jgi:serine protein kinase